MRCPICGCDVEDVLQVLSQDVARKKEEALQWAELPTGADWWEMPTWTSRKEK